MPQPPLSARSIRRALVGAGLVLALIVGAFGWLAYSSSDAVQLTRLDAARAQWAQRSFAHYELTTTYSAESPIGVQAPKTNTYQVRTEGATMLETTVWAYFETIERYLRDKSELRDCGAMRLQCIQLVTTRAYATYHPELGYPTRITFTLTRHHDWRNPTYWHMFFVEGLWRDCTNITCSSSTTYRYHNRVTPQR